MKDRCLIKLISYLYHECENGINVSDWINFQFQANYIVYTVVK